MFMRYNARIWDATVFIAAKVPWILTQVIPMAALLGTLVTLTILSRHAETTALRTAGISLVRIARPFALCGLALCVLTFWLQEVIVPPASTFAQEVRYLRIRGLKSRDLADNDDAWLRFGSSLVHVNRALPEQKLLLGVEAFELGETGVKRHVRAEKAQWQGNTWVLKNAQIVDYSADEGWEKSEAPELAMMVAPAPADLVATEKYAEEMSLRDLSARIRSARAQGLSTNSLEVDWWAKTSIPFTCILMPILSVPFALRTSRRGGLWAGVAIGVGVGFTYFMILTFGIALGRAGVLPPWLAAWAGNFLFLLVATVLFRRAERGL
jgi:lipopolysaccharide export system permease protein